MAEIKEDEKTINSLPMTGVVKAIQVKWPGVPLVTSAELEKMIQDSKDGLKNLVVYDVRPMEEYCISHIEGSQRVNPDCSDVAEKSVLLREGLEKKEVVCYCSLGYRSSKYASLLFQQMRNDDPDVVQRVTIYNLEGSLFKWANETRGMVDNSNQRTIYAHPYNMIWGKLLSYDLRKSTP